MRFDPVIALVARQVSNALTELIGTRSGNCTQAEMQDLCSILGG